MAGQRARDEEPYAPHAPKVRHVWVEFPGGHGPPAPGIVLSWRIERQPSSLATGWSAQVAVVWTLDRLSIEWVSAERLRPVIYSSTPHPGAGGETIVTESGPGCRFSGNRST